jgi:hypothetical protein
VPIEIAYAVISHRHLNKKRKGNKLYAEQPHSEIMGTPRVLCTMWLSGELSAGKSSGPIMIEKILSIGYPY